MACWPEARRATGSSSSASANRSRLATAGRGAWPRARRRANRPARATRPPRRRRGGRGLARRPRAGTPPPLRPGHRAAASASNRRASAGEPESSRALACSRLDPIAPGVDAAAPSPMRRAPGRRTEHDEPTPTHSTLPMDPRQAVIEVQATCLPTMKVARTGRRPQVSPASVRQACRRFRHSSESAIDRCLVDVPSVALRSRICSSPGSLPMSKP